MEVGTRGGRREEGRGGKKGDRRAERAEMGGWVVSRARPQRTHAIKNAETKQGERKRGRGREKEGE